jgi:hypothetical protein
VRAAEERASRDGSRILQYSVWRSLMGRHRDFWRLAEDGLVHACKSLGLALTSEARPRLLETLTPFPT